jgi:hypothetical protein
MMKVYTRNQVRSIAEMEQMFTWVANTFDTDQIDKRWTYGKDTRGFLCEGICNGTWDIEWYLFYNDADAVIFILRWG